MQNLTIPGLVAVRPPVVRDEPPQSLSDAELAEVMKHWWASPYHRAEIDGAVVEALLKIQDKCQFFADVGRNPDLIGVEDFKVAAVTEDLRQNFHPNPVDAGVSLVFVHKRTGRSVVVDAAGRFGRVHDHFSTAGMLREAALGDGLGVE